MVEGIDGGFHFEPKGGVGDGEEESPSNRSVNNEALMIDVNPLNFAPLSHVAKNVRDSYDVSLEKCLIDKAAILENMLNSQTCQLMSALAKERASCDVIWEREIKKDKAYVELERKLAALKEPFTLEKMHGYRSLSEKEFNQASLMEAISLPSSRISRSSLHFSHSVLLQIP
nr:hypothetical protein [Tanacetum cinerariifolium]